MSSNKNINLAYIYLHLWNKIIILI